MNLTDAIWFIFYVSVIDAFFVAGIALYYLSKIVKIPFRRLRWRHETVLDQIQELKSDIWKLRYDIEKPRPTIKRKKK